MKPPTLQQPPPGLNVQDFLYILFRHKWKIALFALIGFGAAAFYYFRKPPVFESSAKLLVRYVVERSAIDSVDSQPGTRNSDNVIKSEIEILTSWDLASEVVDELGVERFVPGSNGSVYKTAVVGGIIEGLSVASDKKSDVIHVSYRNRDPELAAAVLQELLKRYFTKHLEVHRSTGAFEFVSERKDEVYRRLQGTEEELKKLKSEAGILSLNDSIANTNASLGKSRDALLAAEAALSAQRALVGELESAFSPSGQFNSERENSEASSEQVDSNELQRYQVIVQTLSALRSTEFQLLGRYTPANSLVQSTREQIAELDRQRQRMEEKYPTLTKLTQKNEQSMQTGIFSERARLAALVATVEILKKQVREIKETANRVAEFGPQIAQLERRKEAEERKYEYFESSLEKARIDEALDPSKIPNISMLQTPSPALRVVGEKKKTVLALAGGGFAIGLGLAFVIELVFDQKVRRRKELEINLQMPLLLSIPRLSERKRLRLPGTIDSKSNNREMSLGEEGALAEIAPWAAGHFIHYYAESIRDRLILEFKLKNLMHKPKLVGITGVAGGEGASTLAGSLAASLSETGDGKVLLVNLNSSLSQVHPFSDGRPAVGLTEALKANGDMPPASHNLYLATGNSVNGGPSQIAPKQFYSMIPSLKASHFDYIIFDLPPVGRSSATLAMASCLDKVLLVIEAEKSDRGQCKRAYSDLVAARADVAAVLNKTRESLLS